MTTSEAIRVMAIAVDGSRGPFPVFREGHIVAWRRMVREIEEHTETTMRSTTPVVLHRGDFVAISPPTGELTHIPLATCPHCGGEIEQEARFCSHCGTRPCDCDQEEVSTCDRPIQI